MRAAIYERISDDREGRELGVDRQDKLCKDLAKRDGLTVVRVYRDNDLSASTKSRKRRPQYDQMIADAKEGRFEVIVAYASSRLTRRPREHEDLIDLAVDHGVTYLFVVSPSFNLNTADGRQIARMLAAADAAEAERTAERVTSAMRQRAERGEFHGGPRPFGITADGCGIVEEEAKLIRKWYAHVLAGGSLNSITTDLNRAGIPSTTGKTWRTPSIRRILLYARNAGLRVLDGVEFPAPNPPIVPEATWRAAARMLTEPGRRLNDSTARKHLGTGLYVCVRCDCPVNIGYHKDGGTVYRCLSCWRTWKAEPINAWVEQAVAARLSSEDIRERILPRQRDGIDLDALRSEARAIRDNLAALAAEFATARGATREALMAGLRAGETRLEEITVQLVEAGRVDVGAALLAADDPAAEWRSITDLGRKQAVIRLLATIRLGPPIRGRKPWSPYFMGDSMWAGDELTWGEHWAIGAN